jgi:hypothetical protein
MFGQTFPLFGTSSSKGKIPSHRRPADTPSSLVARASKASRASETEKVGIISASLGFVLLSTVPFEWPESVDRSAGYLVDNGFCQAVIRNKVGSIMVHGRQACLAGIIHEG